MNFTALLAALALACVFVTTVEARPRHARVETGYQVGCSQPDMRPCGEVSTNSTRTRPAHAAHAKRHRGAESRSRARDARPRAWCGWQMRQWMGVRNPAGNLARWWAGFGARAHGPAVGTIVVWRHHVGKIVGRASNGQWIVRSGNDGNRVRTRPRSVSNAIAFRWP